MSKTDTPNETTGAALDPWDDPANGIAKMPTATPGLVEVARQAIDGVLPEGTLLNAEIGDPEITSRVIREKIRAGETFDDVFATQKLPQWQEIAGEPVIMLGFHFNKSTKRQDPMSPAVYAVCELGRINGEIEMRQCGSMFVLEQLVRAWEKGWFPFKCKMIATETGTGNTVLRLEKVDG